MTELRDQTVLHLPPLATWEENRVHFFLDGDGPNWIASDARGAALVAWLGEGASFGECVRRYQHTFGADAAKAWVHVHDFCQGLLRRRLASPTPIRQQPYNGRAAHLALERLEECWLHVNDACNLACRHCIVSSSPKGGAGLPTASLTRLIDEAAALGAHRFYCTGGEPFLRPDLPALLRRMSVEYGAEIIVLTNATHFDAERLARLRDLPRDRCRFQISVDGATAATNDLFRGAGTFHRILEGARTIARAGFPTSLTTVVAPQNGAELAALPRLAKDTGARSLHLMWPHRRGRMTERFLAAPETLVALLDAVHSAAVQEGIAYDNWESMRLRVNGLPFLKYDLSNAGWASCCIGPNGHCYPSPALANDPRFDAGDALADGLRAVWTGSPLLARIRAMSVRDMPAMQADPFRFITGGGDLDQILLSLPNCQRGIGNQSKQIVADLSPVDKFYPLYVHMARRIMTDLAERGRVAINQRSGYTAPPILHAMGDGAIPAGHFVHLPTPDTITLGTLHSNCVLSFDVEQPRRAVRQFYGAAAEQPQAELCCPVRYDPRETAHIPAEVLDRFYGCGSPSTLAALQPGETYCDLGSGGGIDCFIAAKKVGAAGTAIGIDMTDGMLAVANRNKALVAERLGYDGVEFRKGYLEQIPVDDGSVHCLTSNCVINLSPDKPAVFREMWRVLRQHGRIVLADVVADRPVPPALQADPHLWGECIAGAMTEAAFLAALETAGFYGLQILRKAFWKSVEGYHFYSLTVRGYKYAKEPSCRFIGQRAIYLGPGKAFVDEEGHQFPRNVAVEVCTDTAAKLRAEPYAAAFHVIESGVAPDQRIYSCDPTKGCC
ncbi:MAG: radical SAM protein [Deltaproteobacteria bacterium]|nr:radical SAM protein [Deltaproteobacteria bacterium]